MPAKEEEQSALNLIAAQLAAFLIKPDDHRKLLVSFKFIAQRDNFGVQLSDMTLGYDYRAKS